MPPHLAVFNFRWGVDNWVQGLGIAAGQEAQQEWSLGILPGLPQLPSGAILCPHDVNPQLPHQLWAMRTIAAAECDVIKAM